MCDGDHCGRDCLGRKIIILENKFGSGAAKPSCSQGLESAAGKGARPTEGGSEPAADCSKTPEGSSAHAAFTTGSTTSPITPCGSCAWPATPNLRAGGSVEGIRRLPISESQIAR